MLKYAMEILLSESSVVTTYYFGWSMSSVSIFLFCLGLTVLPVNLVVGSYISNMFEDRYRSMHFHVFFLFFSVYLKNVNFLLQANSVGVRDYGLCWNTSQLPCSNPLQCASIRYLRIHHVCFC